MTNPTPDRRAIDTVSALTRARFAARVDREGGGISIPTQGGGTRANMSGKDTR